MSVDPNDPMLSPSDPAPDDPVEQLRSEVAKNNAELGRLRAEKDELQRRVDMQELSPRPTAPAPSADQPDELETFILQGMNEGEQAAPWTDTIVKVVKRIIPRVEGMVKDGASRAVRAQALDDELYSFLAEKQGKEPTTRVIRDIERRYGREVFEITRSMLVDSSGNMLPEYQRDQARGFETIYTELERRHSQTSEDFKPPRAPDSRAPTGDRGSSPRPVAPRTNGPVSKKDEVAAFVKEASGL